MLVDDKNEPDDVDNVSDDEFEEAAEIPKDELDGEAIDVVDVEESLGITVVESPFMLQFCTLDSSSFGWKK